MVTYIRAGTAGADGGSEDGRSHDGGDEKNKRLHCDDVCVSDSGPAVSGGCICIQLRP